MAEEKYLVVKRENWLTKFLNKIKIMFGFKKVEIEPVKELKTTSVNDEKKEFLKEIKVNIDNEITMLKLQLDSGKIKTIQLTDEQIETLQKIYDWEILSKQNKIIKLKKVS